MGEKLDSESLREVMTRYFDAMSAELERHGGVVEKFIGDAIMAVFGLPTLHEDDALRAVRAAADMQQAQASSERRAGAALGRSPDRPHGREHGPGRRRRSHRRTAARDRGRRERRCTARAGCRRPGGPARRPHLPPRTRLRRRRGGRAARAEGEGGARSRVPPRGRARGLGASEAARLAARRPRRRADGAGAPPSTLAVSPVAAASSSRSSAKPASASHGSSTSSFARRERAKSRFCAAAASRTATESRSGRSPRPSARRRGSARSTRSRWRRRSWPGSWTDDDVRARVESAIGLSATSYPVSELVWGDTKAARGPRRRSVRCSSSSTTSIGPKPTFLDLVEQVVAGTSEAPLLLVCTTRHELIERLPDWSSGAGARRIVLEPLVGRGHGRGRRAPARHGRPRSSRYASGS